MEHVAPRINLVIVAKTALSRLLAFGEERGWRRLRLLSSAGNSYNRDYGGETRLGLLHLLLGGGRGGCVGTVFAAMTLMVTVNILLVLNVSAFFTTIAEALILILAVLGSSIGKQSAAHESARHALQFLRARPFAQIAVRRNAVSHRKSPRRVRTMQAKSPRCSWIPS